MGHISYDELSEDVQEMIAKLQVEVADLQFEANFYRVATAIAFVVAIERLWDRVF